MSQNLSGYLSGSSHGYGVSFRIEYRHAVNENNLFTGGNPLNDTEKFLFDLQGFLKVPGFLSDAEVNALNDAFDANADKRGEGSCSFYAYRWQRFRRTNYARIYQPCI